MAEFENYSGARASRMSMVPVPIHSQIPKSTRPSLDAISSSAMNSSMPPPSSLGAYSSGNMPKSNMAPGIPRPRSSLGYNSRLPSSHVRSKSSSNVKQISMNSYSNGPSHNGGSNSDMNKSLSMAKEMISSQKQREHQLVNQGT